MNAEEEDELMSVSSRHAHGLGCQVEPQAMRQRIQTLSLAGHTRVKIQGQKSNLAGKD